MIKTIKNAKKLYKSKQKEYYNQIYKITKYFNYVPCHMPENKRKRTKSPQIINYSTDINTRIKNKEK